MFGIHPDGGRELLAEIGAAIEGAGEGGDPRAMLEAFFHVVAPGVWRRLGADRRRRYLENAPLLLATLESARTAVTADDLSAIDLPVLAVAALRCIADGAAARPLQDRPVPHGVPAAVATGPSAGGRVVVACRRTRASPTSAAARFGTQHSHATIG